MRTGADGCRWVQMGAVGYNYPKVRENKRKQDENDCAVYVSVTCMAVKFPEKNMYVRTDKKG